MADGSGVGLSSVPVIRFDEIDSTNAEARRRAEAGEAGPVWISAGRQTAGRGRRGRAWSTETGNLAATLLTTTARPAAQAAQVSFVAALAVHDLVRGLLPGVATGLKWPNDVLVDGRKISGVLIESGSRDDGGLWMAVGVGVNLAHAPDDVDRPATSIAAHGAAPGPDEAVTILAERFGAWEAVWRDYGFEPLADAWRERALGMGRPCIARLGTETVEGVAEGLDLDGALLLRLADGRVRRISAGDVFFGEG